MYKKLFEKLKKPKLYTKTTEKFWDDEHISLQMLEAHLNPEWDAASRKHNFIKSSVDWIYTLAGKKNAKLLDLGCGPGLYTKQFSSLGFHVTGIDYSKRSVEYAKSQDSKGSYIYQNYLEIDYTNEFDIITLIYCDYGALVPEDRVLLLQKVYNGLKNGGMFIFDVFTPNFYADKNEYSNWSIHENGGFWTDKKHICMETRCFYDNAVLNHYAVITEDNIKNYNIWDTFFTKETLLEEVMSVGFANYSLFGDVAGTGYTGTSPTMCIVLEK